MGRSPLYRLMIEEKNDNLVNQTDRQMNNCHLIALKGRLHSADGPLCLKPELLRPERGEKGGVWGKVTPDPLHGNDNVRHCRSDTKVQEEMALQVVILAVQVWPPSKTSALFGVLVRSGRLITAGFAMQYNPTFLFCREKNHNFWLGYLHPFCCALTAKPSTRNSKRDLGLAPRALLWQ